MDHSPVGNHNRSAHLLDDALPHQDHRIFEGLAVQSLDAIHSKNEGATSRGLSFILLEWSEEDGSKKKSGEHA